MMDISTKSLLAGVLILLTLAAMNYFQPTLVGMDALLISLGTTSLIFYSRQVGRLQREIDEEDQVARLSRQKTLGLEIAKLRGKSVLDFLKGILIDSAHNGPEQWSKTPNFAVIKFSAESELSPLVIMAESILETMPHDASKQDLVNMLDSCYILTPTSTVEKTFAKLDRDFVQQRTDFFMSATKTDYQGLGKIDDARVSQAILLGAVFARINHPEKFGLESKVVEKINRLKARYPEIGKMANEHFFELHQVDNLGFPALAALSLAQNGHCDFEQIRAEKPKENRTKSSDVMVTGARKMFGNREQGAVK